MFYKKFKLNIQKIMRKYLIIVLMSVMFFTSCVESEKRSVVNVNPASETVNTVDGENLDLQLVGQLALESKNSEELEKKLNDTSLGINNLDLDGDGKVDYITVTDGENSDPNHKIISLSVNFAEDDIAEVATIEIDKTDDAGGEVHLVGNETVYGGNTHYNSHFSFSDALMFHYMFGPRYRPYYSPYYGYRHPTYYRPMVVVPVSSYRTTVRTTSRTYSSRSNTSFSKNTTKRVSKVQSPNKGKTSKKYATTRSNKQSQKSFSKTNSSQKKKLNSKNSGFKKKTPAKKSTPTKSRSRSRSRSRRH